MKDKIPLAARMRPRTLDEVAGQQHLIGEGKLLRRMIEADRIESIILYGPPSTGKTSLANVIANTTGAHFERINATTAGKADMRRVVGDAAKRRSEKDQKTILFIDEIHRFNKAQQDFLLPFVEDGTITLVGATTENPYFEVNGALLSRSRIFELKPLSADDVREVLVRAIEDDERGLARDYVFDVDEKALDYLANVVDGDIRQALSALELACMTMPAERVNLAGAFVVTMSDIQEFTQTRVMRVDKSGDNHYDFISAYIESMRHSDADAAMYYLARMISAGEDPKYIARRLIVQAAEDVGLANPSVLDTAVSAFLAVERVGLPECAGALAEATLAITLSPKSDLVARSLGDAMALVRETGNVAIPAFLQDESYKGARKLGRGGVSNVYAMQNNFDPAFDDMPESLSDRRFVHLEHPVYQEKDLRTYLDWTLARKREA
jgi:putative ATPase